MTVLVTGGAGSIGAHVVTALQAAGRAVLVLDDLSTGRREAVPDVPLVHLDLARAAGVPAVRLTTSHAHSAVGLGVRTLAGPLRRRVARAGLAGTADYAGLDEAGSMDTARFAATVRAAARRGAATLEINAHPGTADDAALARFDWGYHWAQERQMLLDPAVRALVDECGYRLSGFSGLSD